MTKIHETNIDTWTQYHLKKYKFLKHERLYNNGPWIYYEINMNYLLHQKHYIITIACTPCNFGLQS